MPKSIGTYPDGFTFVKTHKVKKDDSKSAPVYEVETTFDFTGCSLEQIAMLATRDLVIKRAGRIRTDLGNGVKPIPATVNVAASLASGHVVTLYSRAGVESYLDDMDPEEAKAMLERAAAKVKRAG